MATTKQDKYSPAKSSADWLKKVGWLILIWTLSVAALGVAALIMRMIMNAAGLGR